MSRGIHLVFNSISGSILTDGKSFPCPGTTRNSCNRGLELFPGSNVPLKNVPAYSRRFSLTCKASPNNHRRNPDFSRQHKGSSRGKSRQFQERENSDSLEDTDLLPSKNGPVLSLSSNQRYSATATPGRREKEIVELFRKVQVQLRERAAIKEEKKIEASQQGQGERGTVDSLLKLLRKHSAAQGKKSGGEEEFNLERPGRSSPLDEEQNSNFLSSNNITPTKEVLEPDPVPFSRPASNFRRKSPVPRVKFQPVFSVEEDSSTNLPLESLGQDNTNVHEPEPVSLQPNGVSLDELSDSSDTDETNEEYTAEVAKESADFWSLKLSELRGLAKSRGIRGYSKLKKGELVELLSRDGA